MVTIAQIREKAADIRAKGTASIEAQWLDEIADEYEDQTTLNNARWSADMRAIKMWQAAHPGRESIWPDHAELVMWLLVERDKLESDYIARVKRLAARQDELLKQLNDALNNAEALEIFGVKQSPQ